jgi:two-component sensor histidine kinase
MSSIKGLRSLVRLKARRVEQQEVAVQEGRRRLQDARAAHEAAQAEEQNMRAAEQQVRDRLRATTTRAEGFHGHDVVTYQMLVQEAAQATARRPAQPRCTDEHRGGAGATRGL